jgi:hypothetical protein
MVVGLTDQVCPAERGRSRRSPLLVAGVDLLVLAGTAVIV